LGGGLGTGAETAAGFGAGRRGEDLEGDVASEFGVVGAVNAAARAGPELGSERIRAEG
jgi:hypothetical protein